MSSFSERHGYVAPTIELGESDLPSTLLAGLWDTIKAFCFSDIAEYDYLGRLAGYTRKFDTVTINIWFNHFRESVDNRPDYPQQALDYIRKKFYTGPFYKTYDLLEFVAQGVVLEDDSESFCEACNQIFAREKAQFRFAGSILVKITNEFELEEVKESITSSGVASVSSHISRAAELYSQRPQPDFRNSIKESISAVEAAVRFVAGKKSYGVAKPLRLVADEFSLHPALRDGFEKLYAFTSDEQGIRHALLDEEKITQEDAKYMLVACSAFSNYLVALKAKNKN